MYTHSPDPSKQYGILRKIRGSRDQAIPGYFAPQSKYPGYEVAQHLPSYITYNNMYKYLNIVWLKINKFKSSENLSDRVYLSRAGLVQKAIPAFSLCVHEAMGSKVSYC